MHKKYSCLLTFLLWCCQGFSQSTSPFVHLGAGLFSYSGDMGRFDKVGAGMHAGIQFQRKKRLNGAITMGYGRISDDDPEITPPGRSGVNAQNTFFKTSLFFIHYALHYNVVKTEHLTAFVSQGIGFVRFNPKDEEGNRLGDAQPTLDQGEEYRNVALLVPTGVGVIYHFGHRAGVGLQVGFLNTVTDYLDNVSNFGSESGNDNVFFSRLSIFIPVLP